jgi:ABC-type antimicrobial peptide transport system permease subunit
MALGARRGQVVRMVFQENSLIAVVGSVVGLIAAVLASRALAFSLWHVGARSVGDGGIVDSCVASGPY